MSIVKIQIQDADGNIIHPETTSSVVKVNSETLDTKLANIDKSISDEITRAKQKESELTNNVLNVYTKAQTYTKDEITKKITDLIGNSPEGLNTLEEIAKSINNDINFAGTMTNELNKKSNNGHSHDDRYYTESEINTKLDTKFDKSGGIVSGKMTINGAAKDNPLNVRGINGIINNEDGTTNDSELYLNYNTTNPVFINGTNKVYHQGFKPTKSDVGLSNVDNESKSTMFTSPVFTGTPITPTASNSTNNTQIASTAFIHSLLSEYGLDSKAVSASGDWNNYVKTGFYNGSGLTNAPTGLNGLHTWFYVIVITHSNNSDYVCQIAVDFNNVGMFKRVRNSGTWGAWSRIYSTTDKPTKSDIGLGNVDNTSDLAKPISTATQAALDSKLNRSGGSMTGTISWDGLTANKDLLNATGSTDWAKISYIINSSDNCELRNTIGDDTTTKFTWYGNSTNLMTLQPTGNGTTISGADLAINGNITATNFTGTVNGFTIGKSIPSNAVFTDTNTWRGIQDNLTSTATDQSLSANQGKVLKTLVDGKSDSNHGHSSMSYSNNVITVAQPNDYAGLDKKNNVNIDSWYGFSIANKCSNQSIPVDGVAFSVNARSGQVFAKGDFYSNGNKVYHAGYKPSKSDVGLANVDNTSDANKPISTATQAALDRRVNIDPSYSYSNNTETTTYRKLFTITPTSNYCTGVYKFQMCSRTSHVCDVEVNVSSGNDKYINVSITCEGNSSIMDQLKGYLYKNTTTAVTSFVLCAQVTAWDDVKVYHTLLNPRSFTLTIDNTAITALPTDATSSISATTRGWIGNAASSTRATQDSDGKQINTTYVKKGMTWNELEGV